MKRLLWTALALTATMGTWAVAKPEGFYIERLPTGKSVTIPRPATTFVPLSTRVVLTSTDMPQSVSFKPVHTAGGMPSAIRLEISDRYSKQAKTVDLRPGTPFLYSYKSIGSVTVVPEATGARSEQVVLQVESDKPLEIGR